MSDLDGRVALVTGAAAGIGRAVATLLAQQDAEVVAHGRDPRRGAELVDAIRADGGTWTIVDIGAAAGDAMAGTTVRGRIGDPTEIAQVVLFPVQSGSSFVNGPIVGAHGGQRSLLPS